MRRSRVGIAGQSVPIPQKTIRYYDLNQKMAVFVTHVDKGSPASRAGVQVGDFILSFNGKPLEGIDDFQKMLTIECSGKKCRIGLLRNYTEKVEVAIIPIEID